MEVARRHGFTVEEYIDQNSVFLKEEEISYEYDESLNII